MRVRLRRSQRRGSSQKREKINAQTQTKELWKVVGRMHYINEYLSPNRKSSDSEMATLHLRQPLRRRQETQTLHRPTAVLSRHLGNS